MRMFLVLLGLTFSLASAAMKWTISEGEESKARRLELALATSTTKYDDSDCVVGGFDSEDPATVHVGGPCSELDVTMEGDKVKDATPKAGFRYVSMAVMGGGLQNKAGEEAPMAYVDGSAFMTSADASTHAEVGTAASLLIKDTYAGLTVAQASYLSKSSFSFKTNSFPYYKETATGNVKKMETCVTPCCKTHACGCKKDGVAVKEKPDACSGPAIPVVPGQYKFSVFAAVGDGGYGDSKYKAATNGWEFIRSTYGEGTDKTLVGDLFIDQAIDFTGMKSTSVTVNGASSSIKYADMKIYNPKDNTTVYDVKSFSIASDGNWSASYTFPKEYGAGEWTMDAKTYEPKAELLGVGIVKIYAVKFPDSQLVKMKMAKDADEAAKKKIVFLRYVFDVTGLMGSQFSGSWLAYDPTISSAAGAKGASTTAATTGGAAAATTGGAAAATTGGTAATTGGAAATTGGAAATTGGAAAQAAVSVVVTLKNLDFDKIQANTTVKTKLVDSIKQSFLDKLPGYTKQDLTVVLTRGSVVATVKITPKAGSDTTALKATVAAQKDTIAAAAVTSVQALSEVNQFLEAGKSASDIKATSAAPVATTVGTTGATTGSSTTASTGTTSNEGTASEVSMGAVMSANVLALAALLAF